MDNHCYKMGWEGVRDSIRDDIDFDRKKGNLFIGVPTKLLYSKSVAHWRYICVDR